ncbi:collagen-like triple helix repeat-containing protein [Anabaena catenula]|uniref:Collagen-like protein n=1 Tax=Anabaena catenula FACHB-362 TaxID=2692877 RepID=A0ABR8J4Q7_9NOST|nr:collagen-like protein [Anabaena catenula]MBD2692638.1 collagen-like protein [Anabaena catenula FACHB-362]
MSSCDEISAEIAAVKALVLGLENKFALKSDLNKYIKNEEKSSIIKSAINGADLLITPTIGFIAAKAIAPVAKDLSILTTKTLPVTNALSPLVGKVGVLLQIISLISQILIAVALVGRIDALESLVDSIARDLSKILTLITPIKSLAQSALSKAEQALSRALIPGAKGEPGIQGKRGLQGIQGIQGKRGLQGIQGIQGKRGLQGIQGIQGKRGLQGIQGIQGKRGLQGIQGIQGKRGLQGKSGLDGKFNMAELQGIQAQLGQINSNILAGNLRNIEAIKKVPVEIIADNKRLATDVIPSKMQEKLCEELQNGKCFPNGLNMWYEASPLASVPNKISNLTPVVVNTGNIVNNANNNVTKLGNQINNVNNNVTNLGNQVNTTNNNVTKLGNQVSNINNNVNNVKNNVTNLGNQITNQINNNFDYIDDRITNIDNSVNTANENINNVDNSVNNLSNQVTNVNNSVNTTNQNITNLDNSVNNLTNQVTNVNNNFDTTNQNITNVDNSVNNLTNQVTNVNNSVNTTNQNITNLDNNVSNLTNQINGVDNKTTQIQQTLEEIKNQESDCDTYFTTVTVPVGSCELSTTTGKWEFKESQINIDVICNKLNTKSESSKVYNFYKQQFDLYKDFCNARNDDNYAVVPEWWQVRNFQKPQLVVQFAEVLPDGKLGKSRWTSTIPHYNKDKNYKLSIPDYEKGDYEGIKELADNSKIIVNGSNEATCLQVINNLLSHVPEKFTIGTKPPKIGKREGVYKKCKVRAVRCHYFATGQQDLVPTWSKSLRKND